MSSLLKMVPPHIIKSLKFMGIAAVVIIGVALLACIFDYIWLLVKKEEKRKFKMVFIDMDGTLLNKRCQILPSTIKDIDYVTVKKNVNCVFCTGRAVDEVIPYYKMVPQIKYGVCCNGALIYNFEKDKEMYFKGFDAKYAKEIFDIVYKNEGLVHIMAKNSIMSKADFDILAEKDLSSFASWFKDVGTIVEDIYETAEEMGQITKLNLYFPDEKTRRKVRAELESLNLPLVYTDCGKRILEVTDKEINKGIGARLLAKHLDIPMGHTMGIGDDKNDIPLLEAVGYPVAMDNAKEEVFDMASYVTSNHNRNGVGKALRKLCKQKNQN